MINLEHVTGRDREDLAATLWLAIDAIEETIEELPEEAREDWDHLRHFTMDLIAQVDDDVEVEDAEVLS